MPNYRSSKVGSCAAIAACRPHSPTGALRMPVRFNIGNANALLEVLLEAFQLITITMQILPQTSASSVYSVSSQYETATSYLRIPNTDWWTLYFKLALVIAFIWLSSLPFLEASFYCHARRSILPL
jgi:hypothetical protein